MIKTDPKSVPNGEVWEVVSPKMHSEERWIAVRNSPHGPSPWHMVSLFMGGYRRGEDGEITLIRRLTPEVNDDDPIVYSIRQSQVDAVKVVKDEYRHWWAEGLIVAIEGGTPESVDVEIASFPQKHITKLLAVRQAMGAEQDQVQDRLRTIAPDGDEATLAALAANPAIAAALAGGDES